MIDLSACPRQSLVKAPSLVPTDLEAALRELLPCELLGLHLFLGLLHGLLLLLQDHLDVARARHVGVDSAVRAVHPAAALLSRVHLDVLNDEVVGVEVLELGVALGVPEQVEEDLAGLHRPAALCDAPLEGVRLPALPDSALELAEGNALLLLQHVPKILLSALQRPALDGLCTLIGILEVHAEVDAHGLAGLAGIAGLAGVLDHRAASWAAGWGGLGRLAGAD